MVCEGWMCNVTMLYIWCYTNFDTASFYKEKWHFWCFSFSFFCTGELCFYPLSSVCYERNKVDALTCRLVCASSITQHQYWKWWIMMLYVILKRKKIKQYLKYLNFFFLYNGNYKKHNHHDLISGCNYPMDFKVRQNPLLGGWMDEIIKISEENSWSALHL